MEYDDDVRPEYRLVLAFDTDDPEFARGFELGVLYHRLVTEPLPVISHVRATSAEMVLRIGEAKGVKVATREFTDEDLEDYAEDTAAEMRNAWVEVCFGYESGWAEPNEVTP